MPSTLPSLCAYGSLHAPTHSRSFTPPSTHSLTRLLAPPTLSNPPTDTLTHSLTHHLFLVAGAESECDLVPVQVFHLHPLAQATLHDDLQRRLLGPAPSAHEVALESVCQQVCQQMGCGSNGDNYAHIIANSH